MNARALDLIKRSEGLRLTAYLCPAGVPTIGYGSTRGVTAEDVAIKRKIAKATAEALLRHEYEEFEASVLDCCRIAPNENQLGAMTCLAYNIGLAAFRKSSVLRLHNEAEFAAAARAFGLWNKATVDGVKTVLPGLVTRRAAEAALYLEPVGNAPSDESLPQAIESEKPMSQSRTVQAGSLAAGSSILAMASEAARQVAEIRDAMGPWLPYVVLAIGVAAGAWVIWERFGQRRRGEA